MIVIDFTKWTTKKHSVLCMYAPHWGIKSLCHAHLFLRWKKMKLRIYQLVWKFSLKFSVCHKLILPKYCLNWLRSVHDNRFVKFIVLRKIALCHYGIVRKIKCFGRFFSLTLYWVLLFFEGILYVLHKSWVLFSEIRCGM